MILPPKATEAAGKDFAAHPVCSGPFKFVERVPQDHVTLERFPITGTPGDIHFDQVIYQRSWSMLGAAGQPARPARSTWRRYVVPTDAAAVKADPKLRLVDVRRARLFQHHHQPGQRAAGGQPVSARTRWCARRSTWRSTARRWSMWCTTACTRRRRRPCRRLAVLRCRVKPPPRDVAKAKALLKQAGVTLPVMLDLTALNNPDVLQAAEVIQSMAAEAGFDVQIQATEFASSLQASQRGEFEAYLIGWSGRVDLDGNTYQFLHTGQAQQRQPLRQPEVDKLLDEARAVTDVAQAQGDLRRRCGRSCGRTCRSSICGIAKQHRRHVGEAAAASAPVPDGMIRLQGLEMAK